MNQSKKIFKDKLYGFSIRSTFMLDVLRGLAALYVLIGHARWLLWEGFIEGFKLHPETYSFFDTVLAYGFSAFAYGHLAVMLFFVLSGFVIHYSSYQKFLQTNTFSVKQYLFKRFKRIYPPFIIALLITWCLDTIGKHMGYTIYSGNTEFSIINSSIHCDLSFATLLGNLCMLQTLITPVWGSNGPLWSLMYEWWFYLLYIPIFFLNKRHPVSTVYLTGGIFILSLCEPIHFYKWSNVLKYFFAWYFGVLAADIYMGRIKDKKILATLAAYIILILYVGVFIAGREQMNDHFAALVFVVIMYGGLHFYTRLQIFKPIKHLSDFSYTLYVIHFPIIVLLSGWLQNKYNGNLPDHFGYVVSGISICLLLAWGIHFLAEKPFIKTSIPKGARPDKG